MNPRTEVVGIDCLLLRLFDTIEEENMPWLLAAVERIREVFGPALIDLVPSYTTVMVQYDLVQLSAAEARKALAAATDGLTPVQSGAGRMHEVPVWYDPSVGPELAYVAKRADMDVQEVIRRHHEHDYYVFALGFAPGFAFMGLVDPKLATPRLNTPRKRIAAGSVAIAERQTAAYPVVSPGGWNILGRTPTTLFTAADGSLLLPGDKVRFMPVDHATFIALGGDDTPLPPVMGDSA